MKAPGDQLFADSGLAFDQDRPLAGSELFDKVEHPLHGRAVADDLRSNTPCMAGLLPTI
jgi:hypothetical protein